MTWNEIVSRDYDLVDEDGGSVGALYAQPNGWRWYKFHEETINISNEEAEWALENPDQFWMKVQL